MEQRRIVKGMVDDLVLLDTVSERTIVENLRNRFQKDLIYTYIGPVLLSVNPFRDINGLYARSLMSRYTGHYLYERAPHVFGISDEAYRNMTSEGKNQCILVSGESGAGKTEAAKKIMEYISVVSGDLHNKRDVGQVKNALLASNPILEAFGNAKTLRNDNSSRFGKYMEIQMDYGGVPIGGKITNYLLEKPRVVGQHQGERNFHIFYQLCVGAPDNLKKSIGAANAKDFAYLAKSGCVSVKSINDKEDFKEVMKAMHDIGIDHDKQRDLFQLVGAVMWLGNVGFQASGQKVRVSSQGSKALQMAARLLQVSDKRLEKALTHRTYATRGEKMASPLQTVDECIKTRDALAKALYSRAFQRLVEWANKAIFTEEAELTIGVLDIYGFEIFERNSFEQLCINFCNEKLQQLFIELTLKAEQDEYAREGIRWEHIDYFNNKVVCDLIESKRPAGVIAYLDEESIYPRGTDASLLKKLNANLSRHPHYESLVTRTAHDATEFKIKHYAGEVVYSTDGMLDKNKDTLFRDLIEVGGSSKSRLVSSLFPEAREAHDMKKPISAGSQFRTQMQALVDTLELCSPHYIRCIKPNDDKRAGLYNLERVTHQVRYLGLQENVRVRVAGFAYRRTYREFAHRYMMICPSTWPRGSGDARRDTETILRFMKVSPDTFQFGKTKVFLRNPETLFALEEARDRILPDIVRVIQRAYRKFASRKFYLDLRENAMTMFHGHKRRRGSWALHCGGDYVFATTNPKIETALLGSRDNARNILFAAVVDKVSRKGKVQPRTMVITRQSIYIFAGKGRLSREQPLSGIQGFKLSTYADGYVAISFKDPNVADMLVSTLHKAEVVACVQAVLGAKLPVQYGDNFPVKMKKGSKATVTKTISFSEDPSFGKKAGSRLVSKGQALEVGVCPRMGSMAKHQIGGRMPYRMEKAVERLQLRERYAGQDHYPSRNKGW